jgi:thymidylate kinase
MTTELLDSLVEILADARRTVLLRETDLAACVDHGDIDLLVAVDAVPALLDRVDEVASARGLHYRLRRSGPQKVGVQLFSADMTHSVKLDLWEQLWQIFGGRSFLVFEDVESSVLADDGPLPRLPAVLEAAIYVQHLAVKARNPSEHANAARLAGMAERCADDRALADALEGCATATEVPTATVTLAENRLRSASGESLERRGAATRRRTIPQRLHRRRLERRTLGASALVGVDGCGKTSLGEIVADRLGLRTYLTKDAYRRSWLFRGIYKINRSTFKRPYEPIDNLLTPLTHATAAWRLPRVADDDTVLDRYLGDFLVVDRKSDRPRFSRVTALLSNVHRPCRVIHIRASWATISSRKDEVSEKGHQWYDQSMLRYYRSLPVMDYVAFRNDGELAPAADALERFMVSARPGTAP